MSMESKLRLDHWKANGWKISVSGGAVYAAKGKNQVFIGFVKNL